jgi:CheY-like chemotaxis protein
MEPMVLVVDDEAVVRTLISNSLRDHGYRIIETGDGADALRLVKQHRPAAVVLDIELPAVDGNTILQSLRADPDTSPLPVIGMSGYDMDPAAERNFTCFLHKPFSPSDVVFVLAQVAPLERADG